MKRILALLLVVMACFSQVYASDPEADAIRREMKHLKGQQLLQAYSNLCRLASAGEDSVYELRCIRQYLSEAKRQHDVEAEGLARSTQMNCYYNYNMDDSLIKELPACLSALAKNKTWDSYYNSWNVLVEMYIYRDKLQTALIESRKMYSDAHKHKSNYGLGVASYCMGGIYQTMGRFREAEKSLKESISLLSKEEDISMLLAAYNALGETLDGLGKYDDLRIVASNWKAVLDKYNKEALAKGYTPSLAGRYLYCSLAAAVAEIETKHYQKAAQLLKLAEKYAEGRKQIARFKLLQVEARYYAAVGQYDKAHCLQS
jgi:tetratricopeptide (TPR) repeat protein